VGAVLCLLHAPHGLSLAPLLLLLGGLVLEPPVVHDAAHGRHRFGRHLDQIETGILGLAQRFLGRHDAELGAVGSDHADLGHANAAVDTVPPRWGCAWSGHGLSSFLPPGGTATSLRSRSSKLPSHVPPSRLPPRSPRAPRPG